MGMSFMRSSRGFMMKQLAEMLIKKGRKIRCGVGAEEGDSSAKYLNQEGCIMEY